MTVTDIYELARSLGLDVQRECTDDDAHYYVTRDCSPPDLPMDENPQFEDVAQYLLRDAPPIGRRGEAEAELVIGDDLEQLWRESGLPRMRWDATAERWTYGPAYAQRRHYEPALVWQTAANRFVQDPGDRRNGMVTIRVYLRATAGAYHMHGPKLYYETTPSDVGFGNTDQDGLWAKRARLANVTVSIRPGLGASYAFPDYEAFLREIGLLPPDLRPPRIEPHDSTPETR